MLIKKARHCYHCLGPFDSNHIYPNTYKPLTDVPTCEVRLDDVLALHDMSESPTLSTHE